MKAMSAALKAHLAQHWQTMATCVRAELTNEDVYGFSDHDVDIVAAGWSAPFSQLHGTYKAATAITARTIATSDALNVDSTRGVGALVDDSITEEDLLAGLWNDARIIVFQVNWADITMGPLVQRVGWLGKVSVGRNTFDAEFSGLMKRYAEQITELTSAGCRARFTDARCKVDPAPYTVSGALTGVNVDNTTLYDTGRTEPGPTGGVGIVSITNANPGVVTMDDDSLALKDGDVVTISAAGGMLPVNTMIKVRNPSGATFEIGDTSNTTDFPPYTSGGTVTPIGADASIYDGGEITFLTGANEGRKFDVKSYTEGQIVLFQPLPKLAEVGDTYTLVQGCGKDLRADCRDRFDNVVNFRGEPYLPGFDAMIQVARSTA